MLSLLRKFAQRRKEILQEISKEKETEVLQLTSLKKMKNKGPKRKTFVFKEPKSIEDIPFLRQDQRILDSRKGRLMDRQLIRCQILSGSLLISLGVALWIVAKMSLFENESHIYFVYRVAGPISILIGLSFLLCSFEIIIRLISSIRALEDPEIDRITNIHHIKHWMPPDMIPLAWGHESETLTNDSVSFDETSKAEETHNLLSIKIVP